jgi:DNA-binding winged helix-turn-helix (wHTH) protein
MQHADTPIEHGELLLAIWGPEYANEMDYLRTYVRRLRKKIENDASHPQYLLTVPWLGYRPGTPIPIPTRTAGAANNPPARSNMVASAFFIFLASLVRLTKMQRLGQKANA